MSDAKKSRAAKASRPTARRSPLLASYAKAINQAISEELETAAVEKPKAARKPQKPKPRTREGKKGLVIYVDPEVTVALRKLAANNETDMQTLAIRGLELMFAEYDMPMPRAKSAAGA